jgi:glycosyltransferase involved in cell wall biosynthesis
MDLSICLISMEFFNWGKYGGIGKVCRDLGRELANRGVLVSAVIPRGSGQSRVEELDGVIVYSFPLVKYPTTSRIYKKIDAEVYHSQDPSWGTLLAMNKLANKSHIVTCQNPKTKDDWKIVQRFYPKRRWVYNRFMGYWVNNCIKNADVVFCQAKYVIGKARHIYDLNYFPTFLPNPVVIPRTIPHKSSEPTVLFLGRLDGEKDPEAFFRLAKIFSNVRFIVAGKAHNEGKDRKLREVYSTIKNLEFRGFLEREEKERALDESWIIINTSVSECLPVSFLEAAAHRCAILSPHDPDRFASNFGCHVVNGGFSEGLKWLLNSERWKKLGEKGYNYVKETHEVSHVVDMHMRIYKELIERRK